MNINLPKIIISSLLLLPLSLFAVVSDQQRYCPLETGNSAHPIKVCEVITIPAGPVTKDTPVEVRVILKSKRQYTQNLFRLDVEAVQGSEVKALSSVSNLSIAPEPHCFTDPDPNNACTNDISRFTVHSFKISNLNQLDGKYSLRVRTDINHWNDEPVVESDYYFLNVLDSQPRTSVGASGNKNGLPFSQVGWFSPNTLLAANITRRKSGYANISVDEHIIRSTLEAAYKIGIRTIILQKTENITQQYNGYPKSAYEDVQVSYPRYFYPSDEKLFYECVPPVDLSKCSKTPNDWMKEYLRISATSNHCAQPTNNQEYFKAYSYWDINRCREVIPFNVVEKVLEEAERLNMHVIVGLGRSGDKKMVEHITGTDEGPDRLGRDISERKDDNITMMKRKARELWHDYGKYRSFYGWYITHETNVLLDIVPQVYDPIAGYLKDTVVPAKPVMVAPGGIKNLASASVRNDLKLAIQNSEVDIFSYQDRVGANWSETGLCYWPNGDVNSTSCNRLNTVATYYKHLNAIHEAANNNQTPNLKHLWVDMEGWRQKQANHKYYPATDTTILSQIDDESDYVSQIGFFDIGNMLQDPDSIFRFRQKQVKPGYPTHYTYENLAKNLFNALESRYDSYKNQLECLHDPAGANALIPGHCD